MMDSSHVVAEVTRRLNDMARSVSSVLSGCL
jgi:hypothetical protein